MVSGWAVFVGFAGLVVVGSLALGAWVDHQARRRGSRPLSAAAVSRAVKEAKREARASRGRMHIGGAAPHRSPTDPARPPLDDWR